MKSKEQEESDFWDCFNGLFICFIIGAIGGLISMITGVESGMGLGIVFCGMWVIIIFCAIWIWISGKVEKIRKKRSRKNYNKNPYKPPSRNRPLGKGWKRCPSCGHQLKIVAKKCPYCSFQFKKDTKHSSNKNKEKAEKKSNKKEQSNYDMIKNEFGTKKCPKCNKEIIATSVRCKYCKYQFKTSNNKKSNDKESNNKKEIKGRTYKKEISSYERLKKKYGTKKCPNCNKEVISTAEVCKYCKYSFNKNSNKEMYEYKKCPFCEKIILKSDKKCKHCKRAL